eukprot:TRINITY_DN8977_c0_g1_i2.p1 TRINITY_DN8977_c0_g1~~TRINITY_DN8977_c0_g1_i2.p1  ORF type:complete len:265 (-),score=71.58 TRINITY_DN8977_c0_g1_i2:74-868(-)
MIRRPPRSTLSSSSAASDVYKRQMKDRATDACSQRLEKLFRENAAAIADAKSKAEQHSKKIKAMEAQLSIQSEQEETKAVSEAVHAGDARIAAIIERSTAAATKVTRESEQEVSGILQQMHREAEQQKVQTQEEIKSRQAELQDRLHKAELDKDKAIKKLRDEKTALQTQLDELQPEVLKAESGASLAAAAKHAAEESLRKIKTSATQLVASTKNAQFGAMSAAIASGSSTHTMLVPSLDPQVAAALEAAAAANDATRTAVPVE